MTYVKVENSNPVAQVFQARKRDTGRVFALKVLLSMIFLTPILHNFDESRSFHWGEKEGRGTSFALKCLIKS